MICVVCNTSTDRAYSSYPSCSSACDEVIQHELDAYVAYGNRQLSKWGSLVSLTCWICNGPMRLEEVNKTGDHLTCSLECRRKLDEESC